MDVVTVLADQMARVARFSFEFFPLMAGNKNQDAFMKGENERVGEKRCEARD